MNKPLLRKMAMSSPGTYHHSIVVGNLAEAAAKAIGANGLLARVASYYHDIGKLVAPGYFVENQQGLEPDDSKHTGLKPKVSSLVIRAHVKDGVELATKEGLPQPVIDVIREHHGTSVMEFFYNRALEEAENAERDKQGRLQLPGSPAAQQGVGDHRARGHDRGAHPVDRRLGESEADRGGDRGGHREAVARSSAGRRRADALGPAQDPRGLLPRARRDVPPARAVPRPGERPGAGGRHRQDGRAGQARRRREEREPGGEPGGAAKKREPGGEPGGAAKKREPGGAGGDKDVA